MNNATNYGHKCECVRESAYTVNVPCPRRRGRRSVCGLNKVARANDMNNTSDLP